MTTGAIFLTEINDLLVYKGARSNRESMASRKIIQSTQNCFHICGPHVLRGVKPASQNAAPR